MAILKESKIGHAAGYDVVIGQETSGNPLLRESNVTENLKGSIRLVKQVGSEHLGVLSGTAHALDVEGI